VSGFPCPTGRTCWRSQTAARARATGSIRAHRRRPRYLESTFLDWFERWLDDVAASIVDDETLMRVATTADAEHARNSALLHLSRRP
jgi:hypothetical protein